MKISIHTPLSIFELGNRDNQEDYIYPLLGNGTKHDKFFILCDGMGGHSHGEVASRTVCETITAHLMTHWPADGQVADSLINDAISAAYDSLDACDDGAAKSMGTTLTLVVFHKGGCTAAHIGDSRIYHIRPEIQRLLYCSRDHSLVMELYRAGEITYEELKTSPRRNIITKALQPNQERRERPDIVHIGDLRAGDYLFLCSDGMLERMDDKELLDLFCENISDDEKRQRLIDATVNNADNHSAHIIHLSDVIRNPNETVADDEASSVYNALNIMPQIVDAIDVEEFNDNMPPPLMHSSARSSSKKDSSFSPSFKKSKKNQKDYRWIWILIMAIVLLAFFTLVKMFSSIKIEVVNRPSPDSVQNEPAGTSKVSKMPQNQSKQSIQPISPNNEQSKNKP